MNWLLRYLLSSIGKKQLMALTGLSFSSFLVVHLMGNFTMYGGSEYFNAYADTLHKLDPLITVMELGMLFLAFAHAGTGALLFYQNWRARPEKYRVSESAGGKSWGSVTMPYTGLYILVFIIIHLINFHFVDHENLSLTEIVWPILSQPGYVAFYTISMLIVALHVSHGFWSAFQSLGLNHPKYMPAVNALSIIFALVVAIGFGALPIYVILTA